MTKKKKKMTETEQEINTLRTSLLTHAANIGDKTMRIKFLESELSVLMDKFKIDNQKLTDLITKQK
jgi:predicted nuclease with TOPRIM domain